MAKPNPTFKKRQREIKLREKAQLKRENRQQRAMERKLSKVSDQLDGHEIDQASSYDPAVESNT
jgi:hypothetical protein